ncbi:MAG: CBS domain-containing protein, partial [Ktedonobacterales bacterium]|nr:CBS domain-containing protein [Ktedonobacterales bacterium]
HEVISIAPTATIQDAARLLSDYNISGVPVIESQGHMVGIVTEADLISKEGATVADIMTPRVISVGEGTPVDEIAQILTSNRIKRVPIVRGDRVVGIVSRANIVRMMASRWVCPVCGAVQHGRMPEECYSCGADGRQFERELDPRPEITTRQ